MSALPLISSSRRRRRDALGTALSMFKEEWIRDHLLGKAPTTDAAIISSPLQQLHAVSFENDMSFDSVDLEQVGDNMGSLMSSESVMVPAYSKDGLNLGFCLSETASLSSNNFIKCQNGASIAKFIFGEDNGLYVAVTQYSHVEVMLLLSTDKSRRELTFNCFAFHGNSFSELIEQGVNDPAAFERILCANILTQYERQCSHCGASVNTICDCDLRFRASKMPLDLSVIAENMSIHWLGSGVGSGLFQVFSGGAPIVSIPINSTSKSSSAVRHGRAKRFVAWAIADVLKNTPARVQLGLSVPTNDIVRNTELADSGRSTHDCQEQITNSAAHDANSTVLKDYQESLDYSYSAFSPSNQVLAIAKHITDDARLTISEIPSTASSPLIVEQSSTSAHVTNSASILPVSGSHFEPLSLPLTNTFKPCITKDVARKKLSRAIPIAPRNVMHIVPLNLTGPRISDEAKMKKMAEEVREWRAYHRRIRNRESARRSNLVRKQRNERVRRNQRNSSCNAAV